MNIRFRNIKVSNFLSFGEAELSLDSAGYILVKGLNENIVDNASANGVGKSGVFNAICWALCGETIQGVSRDITNIKGTDGALVELQFDVDNDQYRIVRSKDHSKYKTNLIIFKNEENISGKGIRDSEKILQEHLPELSSNLIGSVIILGQGLPHKFSDNTPSSRKEMLEKLSKSDFMINDIKTRLSSRKDCLTSALQSTSDKLIQLNTEKSILERQNSDLSRKLENIPNIEQLKIDQETWEQQRLQQSQQNCKLYTEFIQLDSEVRQLSKKIEENSQKRSQIKDAYDNEYRQTIVPLLEEISRLNGEKSSLQAELQRLSSIKDTCPTCGQKILGVHKPDTTQVQQEIAEKERIISEKLQYKEVQDRLLKSRFESSLESLEDSSSLEKEKTKLLQTIDNIKQKIENLSVESRDAERAIDQIQLQIQSHQDNIDEISHSIDNNNKRIEELNSEILYNSNEKDNITSRIDIINKMSVIANRDFRGHLIRNVLDYVCIQAKQYCKDIFNTELIDVCLNGNNIDITYDGKNYENLSGGEKQRVDIIIQLSIRDMLCNFMNFSSSMIVLDEIFDNLDDIGCQKVLDVISNRLGDVQTIYIITHHADIHIPIDSEVNIVKDSNGISRIVQ